jgi:16S rRNA (uracil1498-N3)-methyltransferase
MQIFYSPQIDGDTYTLDENESRHCVKVLRMSKGDPVNLIDGKGSLYEGYINKADSSKCSISISRVIKDFEKRDYYLHLAISPLKNPERFELFVEKSVEIGIDEITPLICAHTEKPSIKNERIERVIISAMKQSLKARKTILNKPVPFGDFVKTEFNYIKMIAHCNTEHERKGIGDVYSKKADALVLIGPEGDFSPEEIDMAMLRGFKSVHLGRSRLRTETAGIAVCHSIYFLNQ